MAKAWVLDIAVPAGHEALVSRETPKINGSSAAFIALVVALALIIVIACSAVIYLLWESSHGRDRRDRHRRYQPTTSEAGAYTPNIESVDSRKWHSRLGSFFHRHKKDDISQIEATPNTRPGRGGGQGWMQAPGSDWDLATADQYLPPQPLMTHTTQTSGIITPPPPTASGLPNVVQPIPTISHRVSSVLSDISMSVRHGAQGVLYTDPYSPTPQRSIPNIHAQLSPSPSSSSPSPSPPPQPPRTSSPEGLSGDETSQNYPNGRGRPFATVSGTSMRTFEGGTKFIEVL